MELIQTPCDSMFSDWPVTKTFLIKNTSPVGAINTLPPASMPSFQFPNITTWTDQRTASFLTHLKCHQTIRNWSCQKEHETSSSSSCPECNARSAERVRSSRMMWRDCRAETSRSRSSRLRVADAYAQTDRLTDY